MTMNRRDFLSTSSKTLVVGGALIGSANPITALADETAKYGFVRGGVWKNWSHNVQMKPKKIFRPTTLEEFQSIVKASKKIRAVGSGHAISTIAYTEETLLNTEAKAGIISLDREKMEVKVHGGTKLRDFNEAIAALGFCLPSTGDTTYQSLAGLLSTGTHGTGMKWGSCSDEHSLRGMELIKGDGSILELRADREADLPMLKAARISLGSFGIVHTVTLSVVPLHNLEHIGKGASVDEAMDPKNWLENDHYEFAYFPYADSTYQFFRNQTTKPKNTTKIKDWWHEMFLENDLPKILLRAGSIAPSLLPAVMKNFSKSFPEQHVIDRADKVMTIRRKLPTFLMEVAIPIENARTAIEVYRKMVDKYVAKPKRERFYVNLPLQIRFVRGDRGTLISCAQDQDTCWFGLGSSVMFKGWEPFYREMEKELIQLGGRPHWGKMYFTNQVDRHPGYAEWEARRAEFDPEGKFVSRYLERMRTLDETKEGEVF